MNGHRLYAADELMDHWPYLPKAEQVTEFEGVPDEYADNFFLALDASSQTGPLLMWKGSAGCLYGSWLR